MKDIYISKEPQEIPIEDIYSDSSMEPDYNSNGNEPKDKKPKKKKHKHLKRFLKVIIAVIVILTVIITAVAGISGYTRNDLSSNEYISKSDLTDNPLITNILLIGVDGSLNESSRSDSMILVSLDYVHGKIKLTSFLRDSWVYIPSKGSNHKLNSACSSGGAQLVVDTIEYNFKVDIDHYIMVDFDMFTEIIDALGGIDVEITENEASFINRTTKHTVSSGESVHLDGEKALVYSRIRKLDTDYMRTYRQRKVITAIINKVKKTNIIDLIKLANNVLPLLETDLSPLEISGLAYKGGLAALAFDIQQIRIPSEDLMYADYRGSQWVEILDMEGCIEKLYEFIYTSYSEE